jgi:glycosyltransferase involved in cell wall biosynthesis
VYDRSAEVLHPPVRTEFFTPGPSSGEYFLYVGRLVSYKGADVAVRAFAELPHERLVVVGRGHLEHELRRIAPPNVTFEPSVTDERLRDLYRSARALVYPANEDFGIVMAEAQACGTPVIGLAAGGALDIVVPGETGWLIERADASHVVRAVRKLRPLDTGAIRANAERFSSARFRQRFATLLIEAAGG